MREPFFRTCACDIRSTLFFLGYPSMNVRSLFKLFACDSFWILLLHRIRVQVRAFHIPCLNTILRRVQTIVFGIEIGNDVVLDTGVYFVHPIGTVIGGTTRVGKNVRFMGNNTLGTAKDNGYPIIHNHVTLGVGSRILGPICIGQHAIVGANAVVLRDVQPNTVVVGVPAQEVRP